jgi:hypothetical protein
MPRLYVSDRARPLRPGGKLKFTWIEKRKVLLRRCALVRKAFENLKTATSSWLLASRKTGLWVPKMGFTQQKSLGDIG